MIERHPDDLLHLNRDAAFGNLSEPASPLHAKSVEQNDLVAGSQPQNRPGVMGFFRWQHQHILSETRAVEPRNRGHPAIIRPRGRRYNLKVP